MKLRYYLKHYPIYSILYLALLCITINSCKKDVVSPKKSFKEYEGKWRPVLLQDWYGLKAVPFPSGATYSNWEDKIIYVENELVFDTIIKVTVSKEKIRDTCDIQFSITTTVDDNAILTLTENYVLLDKAGTIFKKLNYKKVITLVEGKSLYGDYNNQQSITPTNIAIVLYGSQGTNAWNEKRELVKM